MALPKIPCPVRVVVAVDSPKQFLAVHAESMREFRAEFHTEYQGTVKELYSHVQ